MKRWGEYFRDKLNGEAVGTPNTAVNRPPDNLEIAAPTIAEVRAAIQRLKNNKSAGLDNIPAELFKFGEDRTCEHIHQITVKIWATES